MALVIADTGPIHYLILVEQIDLLPVLFTKAVIPTVVQAELMAARTPDLVRNWILHPPDWLDIRIAPDLPFEDKISRGLDAGEKAAIALATSLHADLLLMDERKGAIIARQNGLIVTGTLGVLDLAAQRGLIVLADVFERLRRTNFYCPEDVMEILLARQKQTRQ